MFGKITEYSAKLLNILLYQEAATAKYQSQNAEFRQFYRIVSDFAKYSAINEHSFHHQNSESSPKDFWPNIHPIFGPNIQPELPFGESLQECERGSGGDARAVPGGGEQGHGLQDDGHHLQERHIEQEPRHLQRQGGEHTL